MTIDDPFGVGLILGALFWALLIGTAVAIGALAFLLLGSSGRETGTAGMAFEPGRPGALAAASQPAEEGGRLDEWDEDRLDRAA